jgi:hypothetical protein
MQSEDLVVSVTIGDKTRAYPLRILVWHEIVNDELAGQPIAVTYCPLCGTAMVFKRQVGNRTLSFGVSGLLHNSDVLMYDRQTDSLWSQLAVKAVSGPQVTPNSKARSEHRPGRRGRKASARRGALRTNRIAANYSGSAYASYEQSRHDVPCANASRRAAERLGRGVIVDGVARAYPWKSLPPGKTVRDEVNSAALEITFHPVSQLTEVRRAESGELLPSVKVYWFAWQAFYPQTGLWQPK